MTATVTVDVIRRVRDDQFRVDASDGPQVLPVLVNDPFRRQLFGPRSNHRCHAHRKAER